MNEVNLAKAKRVRKMKILGLTYKQIGSVIGFSRQRAQQLIAAELPQIYASRCECCKKRKQLLHRHHHDYSKDDVEIICASCHGKKPKISAKELDHNVLLELSKMAMTPLLNNQPCNFEPLQYTPGMTCKCVKCGYTWKSRPHINGFPKSCPECKSRNWMKGKKRV